MKRKIVVIKYGSSSVSHNKGIDHTRLEEYAAGLALLHRTHELVLVSSGSVVAGRVLWDAYAADPGETVSLRTLAMLGSGQAFTAWQTVLLRHGIIAGQLLVTHREVDDPSEGPSLRAAVAGNMRLGIVTVVNENDALSDLELAKLSYGGDNDGLAAHIALSLDAQALLLMTDVAGLQIDGRTERHIAADELHRQRAAAAASGTGGVYGRGGMASKVTAALQAARGGIEAYVAKAGCDARQVLAGGSGTHFVADQNTK